MAIRIPILELAKTKGEPPGNIEIALFSTLEKFVSVRQLKQQ
jgi:hypothetical protein